ncbi:MAG: CYTH domain-containing protein [Candidatus Peribacteria bacterium]|nr:MAG: CYTH domain-containing protein [Candidatus Peribacteria bacterium]
MLRRIFRDVTRTGEKPGDILKYFSKVVEPKEYEHIEPTKKYADIVVENLYVPFVESRNSRHKETQLKYEVSPDIAKEVGRVVHSLGGIFVGEVFDQDLFLLANSRDLKKTDEIMRIRLIGLGRYILSYRGPKVKGKEFDARYGINFYIDYDTYTAFHSVYGHISKVLNKQRKNYFLKGFLISVDTFESGKVYLDIRVEDGSQKAVLESLLQNLGLSGRKPTTQTYLELIH